MTLPQLAEKALTAYWQDRRVLELTQAEYDDFKSMSRHPGFPKAWDVALWEAARNLNQAMPKWGSKMGIRLVSDAPA